MKIEPHEIPDSWEFTTMGDISTVIGGGTPKTKEPDNFEGGSIPWLTPADLSGYTRKNIGYGKRFITEKGLSTSSARVMPTGTVLYTSRAPIGYVAVASNPICTNQGFKSFILNTDISPDYVYWYLKGTKDLAESLASGTTFLELSGTKAKQIPIPIAPLNEQKRIAAEIEKQFSRLDKAVTNLKRVKANLKRYKASVLKAAVEGKLTEEWRKVNPDVEPAGKLLERILAERRKKWEEAELAKMKAKGKELKDDKWKKKYKEPPKPDKMKLPRLPRLWEWATFAQVSSRVTVGHVGSMKDEYVESGIPFLRSQNVRENRFDKAGLKFISINFHEKLQKSKLEPGDIVVVRSGAVGVTCVIPSSLKEANCSDLVIVKQPTGILPEYGAYYMNSIRESRVASKTVGVALRHFNTQSVAAMPIPLPTFEEQKRIVDEAEIFLSATEEMDKVVDKSLKRADRLRQTILQHAFSGRLVSQNPEDEPANILLDRVASNNLKQKLARPKKGRKKMAKIRKKIRLKPIIDVLSEMDSQLSTKRLLELSGRSVNGDPDTMEEFYLELKAAIVANLVFVERKGDFDYFVKGQ